MTNNAGYLIITQKYTEGHKTMTFLAWETRHIFGAIIKYLSRSSILGMLQNGFGAIIHEGIKNK